MKVIVLLALCAVAAANSIYKDSSVIVVNDLPESDNRHDHPSHPPSGLPTNSAELLQMLRNFVENVVKNGWSHFGIPPLEPLVLDSYHLTIPAGLINLDLQLKGVFVAGFSGYVIHRSEFNVHDLSYEIDIGLPALYVLADEYNLVGDMFTAIPLYGKGRAEFEVDGFRFRAKLYLMHSADRKSVIIRRVENASFTIPSVKSNLDGVIGGGDVDAIVNAMIEQVIIDYLNRFRGAIAIITSDLSVSLGNPMLEQLDSWRYIDSVLSNDRQ